MDRVSWLKPLWWYCHNVHKLSFNDKYTWHQTPPSDNMCWTQAYKWLQIIYYHTPGGSTTICVQTHNQCRRLNIKHYAERYRFYFTVIIIIFICPHSLKWVGNKKYFSSEKNMLSYLLWIIIGSRAPPPLPKKLLMK